jgi:hypothetical protein
VKWINLAQEGSNGELSVNALIPEEERKEWSNSKVFYKEKISSPHI